MKVLVISQWYKPEPAHLIHQLAQTLMSRGHEVTVLTGFPNYPTGRIYPGYRLHPWQREIIDGVPLIRVPLYPDHSQSPLRRASNYLSFALSAAVLGPWLVPKPDVIFVYHPPLTVAIPAVIIGLLRRAPIVYQIQDMWPETLKATGMVNSSRVLRWVGRAALLAYRSMDAICVISPGFRDNLIAKGVAGSKIHVVPNWVDPTQYYPVTPDSRLASELNLKDRFNVMFAGNTGKAQALHTLLAAASLLRDLHQVQFVIVGEGVELQALRKAATRENLSNVVFLGPYPAEAMPRLYSMASVLLVHLKDEPLFRITIPHKILSYMASGKPILGAVSGDAARLIETTGAGITCSPEDPHVMAQAVREFFHLSSAARQQMARSGLLAAHQRFGRETLVGQIESILQKLAPMSSNTSTKKKMQ